MLPSLLSARWLSVTSLQPSSKLGSSGGDSQVGGLVYVLGLRGSLQWTLLWGWEFLLPPHTLQVLQSEVLTVFPHTGIFPTLELWVTWSVLLPSYSSQFIHMQMWDCPVCQPLPWLVCQQPPCPPRSFIQCLAMIPLLPSYRSGWMFLL